MTLIEARDALNAKYAAEKKTPMPITMVVTGVKDGRDVLNIWVNKKFPSYVPEESKPGVGFEGFEVVSYLGVTTTTMISDSGVIPS